LRPPLLANDLRTFDRYPIHSEPSANFSQRLQENDPAATIMAQIVRGASEAVVRPTPRSNRVFLLRCWQENGDLGDDERTRWRFLLEEVAPQRGRKGFVALDDLLAFLRQEFEGNAPPVLREHQV